MSTLSTEEPVKKRCKIDMEDSGEKSNKTVKTETIPHNHEGGVIIHKQPIIAPNGKVFFPCQYCCKIFPQKLTSISHMKKCTKKNGLSVLKETESNTNDLEHAKKQTDTENIFSESENQKQNIGASVYDYNEQDEILEDRRDSTVQESANNRSCKHCNSLFDNPLDLLRHTRDCHNFPKKILAPDEIEKYFDYPNRLFCPICEKPIKTRNFRSVFIKHLLVHTTGLTHECGICKKKFRRRDHMRAHERRHIVSI